MERPGTSSLAATGSANFDLQDRDGIVLEDDRLPIVLAPIDAWERRGLTASIVAKGSSHGNTSLLLTSIFPISETP